MGRALSSGYDDGSSWPAKRVAVDPSSFSGNLSVIDEDLQHALETIDALDIASTADLAGKLNLDQTTPQKIINGYPINGSQPTFTYTSGVLTRVDYPSGFYKVLAYNLDGTLNTITYSNGTVKTMNWSSGVLQSIGVA